MLTVMTWNVENLFAGGVGYAEKVDALVGVVQDVAPDLVAVQEVGDPTAFEALRAGLGEDWTGVLAQHFEPSHAIRVGWLAHGPLGDVDEVVDLPAALSPVTVRDDGTTITRMGRGALGVTYTHTDGTRVRAVAAHLKSKLLSFPPLRPGGPSRFSTKDEGERARYGVYALGRRATEAAAVRGWVTDQLAGAWAGGAVVVCGDLNDTPDAATTQLLLGPPGSQLRTGGFSRPDKGDAQRLWNVAPVMTPPDDYSRIHEGRGELIDHVLVSHALASRLDHAGAVPMDGQPSVTSDPATARAGEAPSDHRPVVAVFRD